MLKKKSRDYFFWWKYKFKFSTKNFDIGKFDIFLHLRKPLFKKSRKINVGMNIQWKNKSYFAGFPNILKKKIKKISIYFFLIIFFRRNFWDFPEFQMILYNRPGSELSANITNVRFRVEIMLKIKFPWNSDQKYFWNWK